MTNLTLFVERARRVPQVQARLRAATARRGRCPRHMASWLRGKLTIPLSKAYPSRIPPSTSHVLLDLSDLAGGFAQFPELLTRLSTIPAGVSHLTIHLGEFFYATGLAVLAEHIERLQMQNSYDVVGTPGMQDYLNRINFHYALKDRPRELRPSRMDWAVGLTRIGADRPSDEIANDIFEIICTFINVRRADQQSLFILIAEMIENVIRHARITRDGFAIAQVYPRQLKMGLAFVDSGIGVRRSFEEGEPSVSISGLREDVDFLRAACELHVTSKARAHSGYGLFLLSQVIANNHGTFLLSSGHGTLVAYQERRDVRMDALTHGAWEGTVVAAIVDLHQELSVGRVYAGMPPLEGMEDAELFT
jgi:anti-sigma regulatory factor (Ser/Thr protein kinase)